MLFLCSLEKEEKLDWNGIRGVITSSPGMHRTEAEAEYIMAATGFFVAVIWPPFCFVSASIAHSSRSSIAIPAVIANMRGDSPEEVAALLMAQPGLQGLQGPTISPVYGPGEPISANIMALFVGAQADQDFAEEMAVSEQLCAFPVAMQQGRVSDPFSCPVHTASHVSSLAHTMGSHLVSESNVSHVAVCSGAAFLLLSVMQLMARAGWATGSTHVSSASTRRTSTPVSRPFKRCDVLYNLVVCWHGSTY